MSLNSLENYQDRFSFGVQKAFSTPDFASPRKHPQPGKVSFGERRKSVIQKLFGENPQTTKIDQPQAFFSEWATLACLEDPLNQKGLSVRLAPADLEAGSKDRKGIDLYVMATTDTGTKNPMLGINVKLRGHPDHFARENKHYDPIMQSPSITLSLGNWYVDTRERPATQIRGWMHELAVPTIRRTGKVPYLIDLRRYVMGRINYTLDLYMIQANEYLAGTLPPTGAKIPAIPRSRGDFPKFYSKLQEMQKVFAALSQQYT